jgi:hypothetical protein
MAKESKKAQKFIKEEMHKFKKGKLHSGSKKGPEVENPKQAIAIALSSARKKGMKVGKRK